MRRTRESGPPRRRGALRRLRAIVRKEFLQIGRDPSSIAIAFVLPLILLLIFGYGVSLDAKNVPLALVVEEPSARTASFTAAFARSPYFHPVPFAGIRPAEEALLRGRVDGIVWLRENFARDLYTTGAAPIGVLINGADANTARIIGGYLQGAWINWLGQSAAADGRPLEMPAVLEQRVWFNPELRSRDFLVPGLIAIIMTLIGALLTAMVVAREWERGTMEALMVTPVSAGEFLLGKLIPYFLLGMGGMALSVGMAVWLFRVPLQGSLAVLFGTSALFLLTALGMGLLISTAAKNQFVAGQVAIIVTYLPAFILSGFIFDIGSMPQPIQWLTHLMAARYFVSILQTVFLAGDVASVIIPDSLALLAIMGVLFFLVRKRTRKRLQ